MFFSVMVLLLIIGWFILSKFDKPKDKEQKTKCFCPNCRNELISSKSLISDEDLVLFKCTNCSTESTWHFDTPVPILHSVKKGKDSL